MIERKIRTNPEAEKILDKMGKIQRNKSQINIQTMKEQNAETHK
jgi:hypothetical protein